MKISVMIALLTALSTFSYALPQHLLWRTDYKLPSYLQKYSGERTSLYLHSSFHARGICNS